MGAIRSAPPAVHQHRWTIDGSPFLGILLGLLVVVPFWILVACLVWMLT